MAEPRVRFKRNDGSSYPPLVSGVMGDYYTERNEKGNSSLAFLTVSIHSGISDGELDEDSLGKRVKRTTDPAQNKKVESGDLVFNMMRAWQGAVGCAKSAGMVSPAYVVACPDARIYPPYMDLYVKTKPIVDQFNRLSYGALDFRKRLYWDSFITTEINLPCIEEQQKIADFLSSVDEIITTSEQEVANLETQKKAAMKKIFSQEVRFKRADGSAFPEWESMSFGNVFSFKNGVNASREAFRSDGVKCIGVSDVYRCQPILEQNIVGSVSLSQKEIERYSVKYGDILFQRSSETREDIGHASVYVDNGKSVFNGFVICARPNSLFYNPYYMHYVLQSDDIRTQTIRLGAGAQHYNIGQESLSSLVLPLPCLEEQRLIADFLSDFDEAIAAAKKELELWKELKKGLLQQMFV